MPVWREAAFLAGVERYIRKWFGPSGWAVFRVGAGLAAARRTLGGTVAFPGGRSSPGRHLPAGTRAGGQQIPGAVAAARSRRSVVAVQLRLALSHRRRPHPAATWAWRTTAQQGGAVSKVSTVQPGNEADRSILR